MTSLRWLIFKRFVNLLYKDWPLCPYRHFLSFFFPYMPTSLMGMGSRENGQEATPGRVGIRHHLQEHLVARRNQGSGLERPTEAAESLPVGMPAVNVHIVVAAQVVTLQVNEAEWQDHHLALRDLVGNVQRVIKRHFHIIDNFIQ